MTRKQRDKKRAELARRLDQWLMCANAAAKALGIDITLAPTTDETLGITVSYSDPETMNMVFYEQDSDFSLTIG